MNCWQQMFPRKIHVIPVISLLRMGLDVKQYFKILKWNFPYINLSYISTCVYSHSQTAIYSDSTFSSKGLHFCNLNIQYIIPKADELRAIMANNKCPDILGLCKTFLNPRVIDLQVEIDGYYLICKDMTTTQKKQVVG